MSKVELSAYERFAETQEVEVVAIVPNKKELGRLFKKDAKPVCDALEAMSECDAMEMAGKLAAGQSVALAVAELPGGSVEVLPGWVDIKRETRKMNGRSFTPAVIEPSFGIGRILYCVFEHCFYTREGDEQRSVFSFTPVSAPVKCTVFPLLQRAELNARAEAVAASLTRERLSNTIDTTGNTIGKRCVAVVGGGGGGGGTHFNNTCTLLAPMLSFQSSPLTLPLSSNHLPPAAPCCCCCCCRYARTDEIGVPFAVTIDFQTLEDDTATLRERDTTAQVRVPLGELPALVRRLAEMEVTWGEVSAQYPAQAPAAGGDE